MRAASYEDLDDYTIRGIRAEQSMENYQAAHMPLETRMAVRRPKTRLNKRGRFAVDVLEICLATASVTMIFFGCIYAINLLSFVLEPITNWLCMHCMLILYFITLGIISTWLLKMILSMTIKYRSGKINNKKG